MPTLAEIRLDASPTNNTNKMAGLSDLRFNGLPNQNLNMPPPAMP